MPTLVVSLDSCYYFSVLATKLIACIHIELLSALIEVLANSLGSGDKRFEVFMGLFVLSCICYVFVRVCLYVLCGHLLGKG